MITLILCVIISSHGIRSSDVYNSESNVQLLDLFPRSDAVKKDEDSSGELPDNVLIKDGIKLLDFPKLGVTMNLYDLEPIMKLVRKNQPKRTSDSYLDKEGEIYTAKEFMDKTINSIGTLNIRTTVMMGASPSDGNDINCTHDSTPIDNATSVGNQTGAGSPNASSGANNSSQGQESSTNSTTGNDTSTSPVNGTSGGNLAGSVFYSRDLPTPKSNQDALRSSNASESLNASNDQEQSIGKLFFSGNNVDIDGNLDKDIFSQIFGKKTSNEKYGNAKNEKSKSKEGDSSDRPFKRSESKPSIPSIMQKKPAYYSNDLIVPRNNYMESPNITTMGKSGSEALNDSESSISRGEPLSPNVDAPIKKLESQDEGGGTLPESGILRDLFNNTKDNAMDEVSIYSQLANNSAPSRKNITNYSDLAIGNNKNKIDTKDDLRILNNLLNGTDNVPLILSRNNNLTNGNIIDKTRYGGGQDIQPNRNKNLLRDLMNRTDDIPLLLLQNNSLSRPNNSVNYNGQVIGDKVPELSGLDPHSSNTTEEKATTDESLSFIL